MMQIMVTLLVVFLFFSIAGMLGYIFERCTKNKYKNILLTGFFLYFTLFQILYLPLMFLKQPLHILSTVWGIVCSFIIVVFLILFFTRNKISNISEKVKMHAFKWNSDTGMWLIMLTLLMIQMFFSITSGFNGWDTAYYISNVVQSMDTDTMYLFDGYTGVKDTVINMRYAMCSYFMHSAVIGDIFQIHGAVVCRFFNTAVCHIFSAYVVYLLGKEVWNEKGSACALVSFWILANFGLSTMYFACQFLMIRSYEAKACCANIVLPAILLIIIRIFKHPEWKGKWWILLPVNIAAVAISSSCLLLVPFLEGLMMLSYLITTKKGREIGQMFLCLFPCICYLGLYVVDRFDIWKIVI